MRSIIDVTILLVATVQWTKIRVRYLSREGLVDSTSAVHSIAQNEWTPGEVQHLATNWHLIVTQVASKAIHKISGTVVSLVMMLRRPHRPKTVQQIEEHNTFEQIHIIFYLASFLHTVRPRLISAPAPANLKQCKNWRCSSGWGAANADPFEFSSASSIYVRESTMSSCWHSLL